MQSESEQEHDLSASLQEQLVFADFADAHEAMVDAESLPLVSTVSPSLPVVSVPKAKRASSIDIRGASDAEALFAFSALSEKWSNHNNNNNNSNINYNYAESDSSVDATDTNGLCVTTHAHTDAHSLTQALSDDTSQRAHTTPLHHAFSSHNDPLGWKSPAVDELLQPLSASTTPQPYTHAQGHTQTHAHSSVFFSPQEEELASSRWPFLDASASARLPARATSALGLSFPHTHTQPAYGLHTHAHQHTHTPHTPSQAHTQTHTQSQQWLGQSIARPLSTPVFAHTHSSLADELGVGLGVGVGVGVHGLAFNNNNNNNINSISNNGMNNINSMNSNSNNNNSPFHSHFHSNAGALAGLGLPSSQRERELEEWHLLQQRLQSASHSHSSASSLHAHNNNSNLFPLSRSLSHHQQQQSSSASLHRNLASPPLSLLSSHSNKEMSRAHMTAQRIGSSSLFANDQPRLSSPSLYNYDNRRARAHNTHNTSSYAHPRHHLMHSFTTSSPARHTPSPSPSLALSLQGIDERSLEAMVSLRCEQILRDAAEHSLKAVELANTLRARVGTEIMAVVRERWGGLLSLLERQNDRFLVERIPKNDRVSLRRELIAEERRRERERAHEQEQFSLLLERERELREGEAISEGVCESENVPCGEEQSTEKERDMRDEVVTTSESLALSELAAGADYEHEDNSDWNHFNANGGLSAAQEPTRCLHVGNVPATYSEMQLIRDFERFGQLEGVKLITQKNRRFAFITYKTVQQACAARHALSKTHPWKSAISFAHRDPSNNNNNNGNTNKPVNWYASSHLGSHNRSFSPSAMHGLNGISQHQTLFHPHRSEGKMNFAPGSVLPHDDVAERDSGDWSAQYGSGGNNGGLSSFMPSSSPSFLGSQHAGAGLNSLSALHTEQAFVRSASSTPTAHSAYAHSLLSPSAPSPVPSASLSLSQREQAVLQRLCDDTYVPTQPWAADAEADLPFCRAVLEQIAQFGGNTTISKLRGFLKHRVGTVDNIKSVPLKAMLNAYPSLFKVEGNLVAVLTSPH